MKLSQQITTIAILLFCVSTQICLALDARLISLNQEGNIAVTKWPTIESLGGNVSFEVALASSSGLSDSLYLTVFRSGSGIPLPVVTRTGTVSLESGNRYKASFTLSLPEPTRETNYQLAFWTTYAIPNGQPEKLDVGEALLVCLPKDALEPLRQLAMSYQFVVDADAKSLGGLKTAFGNRSINFSQMSKSEIASLGKKAIFFSEDAATIDSSRVAGNNAVVFLKDATTTIIHHRSNSATAVVLASSYSNLGGSLLEQRSLLRLLQTMPL